MSSEQKMPAIIPLEFADAWQQGEVREVIHIAVVPEMREALYEMPDCYACDGPLVYSSGPFSDLYEDTLLVVDNIMAYRCLNEDCSSFEKPIAFLPENITELRRLRTEATALTIPGPPEDSVGT